MAEQQVARWHSLYLYGKEHQETLAAELGVPEESNKHKLLLGQKGNGKVISNCARIRHSSVEKHNEL